MARQEFSPETKEIIRQRAGLQCSFPTCSRITVGAGPTAREITRNGEACHIYAAAEGGPRGQGNLTPEELIQPENGIWLCSDHATLVDSNSGRRYPPEVLLIYKRLQEARVQREQQGLYAPEGWLHELTIRGGLLSPVDQTICFAKLNLFYGPIATGKTAVLKWLRHMLGDADARWIYRATDALRCELIYLNPEVVQIGMTIPAGEDTPRFLVDGRDSPFTPLNVRFIWPTKARGYREPDDAKVLAECLGIGPRHVPKSFLANLFKEVDSFRHAHIRNLRFEESVSDDGELLNRLVLDCDGTHPGLSFQSLSGGEKECVIIELATAIARASGRYSPTVLVLDDLVEILFDEWLDYYSHQFLDAENRYQTFLCLGRLPGSLSPDQVQQKGWEVVHFTGQWGDITIRQLPRNT